MRPTATFLAALFAHSSIVLCADYECDSIGGVKFKENCFVYVDGPKSFENASANCLRMSGALATIQDVETERFLKRYYLQTVRNLNYWIGVRKNNFDGSGSWAYNGYSSELTYTNWDKSDPDNMLKDMCVAMNNKNQTWELWDCYRRFFYICQHKGLYYDSTHCNSNSRFEGSCYTFSRRRATYITADGNCNAGFLAEITTRYEQKFIAYGIQQEKSWWESLTDYELDNLRQWPFDAWIGIFPNPHTGKLMHTDGSITSQKKSHKPPGSSRQCVLMSSEYASVSCSTELPSFCQFNAGNVTSDIPRLPTSGYTEMIWSAIVGALTILIGIPLVVLASLYYRRNQNRRLAEQQAPPPVPPREDETRSVDGYLVPTGRQYLDLISGSRSGEENVYSYVTDVPSTVQYLLQNGNPDIYGHTQQTQIY